MHIVERLLSQHFPDSKWEISKPQSGLQKESFIATDRHRRLFIKLDTDLRAWSRLAEIEVTPPVLALGTLQERTYLIQEYVQGTEPDRAWFGQNAAALARIVRRYQSDAPLKKLLNSAEFQPFTEHIHHEVATLQHATVNRFTSARFQHQFQRFQKQSTQLKAVPLVPVHADPSSTNMLVTQHGLTLLDWDEILLSHPMRDVGLIVWWYLPPDKWQTFFDAYGAPLEREVIFWWVARRSLELACWFDVRGADSLAKAFLDDFYRAMQQQDNPQITAA